MKNTLSHIQRVCSTFLFILILFSPVVAQEAQEGESEKDLRPVRGMFECIWLIDNPSAMVPFKGTFEFDIQHRFGPTSNGLEDFFGLYGSSNIRLGFNYVPIERLMIGFGVTRFTNIPWDFNAKYAILQQARKGGSPVALTYFVNANIQTTGEFERGSDRYSYFHQLIVARKITDKWSLQAAGSVSHFNAVNADADGNKLNENDHVALAISTRYKLGGWVNFIANVDIPLTDHMGENADPEPNISFGLELTSSSHQFQLFAGNFYSINPQRNNLYNRNDFGAGDVLIGFNVTRLWNF